MRRLAALDNHARRTVARLAPDDSPPYLVDVQTPIGQRGQHAVEIISRVDDDLTLNCKWIRPDGLGGWEAYGDEFTVLTFYYSVTDEGWDNVRPSPAVGDYVPIIQVAPFDVWYLAFPVNGSCEL